MTEPFTRYVITLTRNPDQSASEALVRTHVAYLRELDRKGQLDMAGPFEDGGGGMLVIKAQSMAEARAIAEADPFVSSGFEDCEVRTWLLSCEDNNHMGMG